ncbi:MAG: substrate-binding domain-containing protein [Thiohalocapsa sp.]
MLNWGSEFCEDADAAGAPWHHEGTNLVLDFHGDPARAELCIFSDGNHHMALLEAVCAFRKRQGLDAVFYTTTPPGPLVAALKSGGLQLGNLLLRVRPHVFISPEFVLEPMRSAGRLGPIRRLFNSRGNVLIVPAGNPKGIRGIADLARNDLRLFLSNPETEKASYQGYRATLDACAKRAGIDLGGVTEADPGRIVYGERIHHREAARAVASGAADCAVVYHHLGLRYTRIFPEQLEMVALEKQGDAQVASSHIALIGDGGSWGQSFVDFMIGDEVAEIYRHHGMDAG